MKRESLEARVKEVKGLYAQAAVEALETFGCEPDSLLTKEAVKARITAWAGYYTSEFCCSLAEEREVGKELDRVLEWIESHAEAVPAR